MRWGRTALFLGLGVAACTKAVEVPRNAGVCWRLAPAMNGQQDFRPLSTGVENLETCAVQLEGLHLVHGQPVVGGFQGRIIYVTQADITAAAGVKTQRYRVFSPEQRAKIDSAFKDLNQRSAAPL